MPRYTRRDVFTLMYMHTYIYRNLPNAEKFSLKVQTAQGQSGGGAVKYADCISAEGLGLG